MAQLQVEYVIPLTGSDSARTRDEAPTSVGLLRPSDEFRSTAYFDLSMSQRSRRSLSDFVIAGPSNGPLARHRDGEDDIENVNSAPMTGHSFFVTAVETP